MKCEVCEKYKENIREYFKEYNARPDVKQRKHEEYIQKLIKENTNAKI